MTIQLVFVGHHGERVLESIRTLRELPTSKFILFVGNEELPGEKRARETEEWLKRGLKVIWDVEIERIARGTL